MSNDGGDDGGTARQAGEGSDLTAADAGASGVGWGLVVTTAVAGMRVAFGGLYGAGMHDGQHLSAHRRGGEKQEGGEPPGEG